MGVNCTTILNWVTISQIIPQRFTLVENKSNILFQLLKQYTKYIQVMMKCKQKLTNEHVKNILCHTWRKSDKKVQEQ